MLLFFEKQGVQKLSAQCVFQIKQDVHSPNDTQRYYAGYIKIVHIFLYLFSSAINNFTHFDHLLSTNMKLEQGIFML